MTNVVCPLLLPVTHDPASRLVHSLRLMHSLQLPQLPHSGRFLTIKPSPRPATASTKTAIAINNVVIISTTPNFRFLGPAHVDENIRTRLEQLSASQ